MLWVPKDISRPGTIGFGVIALVDGELGPVAHRVRHVPARAGGPRSSKVYPSPTMGMRENYRRGSKGLPSRVLWYGQSLESSGIFVPPLLGGQRGELCKVVGGDWVGSWGTYDPPNPVPDPQTLNVSKSPHQPPTQGFIF